MNDEKSEWVATGESRILDDGRKAYTATRASGNDARDAQIEQLRGSLEPMLHAAIMQAVALMNVCPEVARSEEARKAHVILRVALVEYADAYMDQPAPKAEREAMRKKHGGA